MMRDLPEPPAFLEVRVIGIPAGQGNLKRNAEGISYHANSDVLKPWRQAVTGAACRAAGTHEFMPPPGVPAGRPKHCVLCSRVRSRHGMWTVPMSVRFAVYLQRKPAWAALEEPTSRRTTDIDHHARAIFDALSFASVWTDDSIVVAQAGEKHFADGRPPGAEILIAPYTSTGWHPSAILPLAVATP